MSTNYYFQPTNDNPLAAYGSIHVGKSSAGWTFSFHGYDIKAAYRNLTVESGLSVRCSVPELIVKDFPAVVGMLESGGKLTNEYGETMETQEFIEMVLKKQSSANNHGRLYPNDDSWVDARGHSFGNYDFC